MRLAEPSGSKAERATPFGYNEPLDGLRAVAVLMIVAFHARSSWFPGAYIGVDIFFVLSGFLITSVLVTEYTSRLSIDLRGFYLRRALRLLPALVVTCVVVVLACWLIASMSFRGETLAGALHALTYTSSIAAASGTEMGWMIHTWSLSVEELFYVGWPFLLVLILRTRHREGWMMLVVLALMLYTLAAGTIWQWSIQRLAYGFDVRAQQLALGGLLAVCTEQARRYARNWIVVLAASLLTAFALTPTHIGETMYYRYGGSIVVALLASVVVVGSTYSSGLLRRTLSVRPMTWVGKRAYGIYLWNLPIVGVLSAVPLPPILALVAKLGLTFIVPALSYRFLETPFLCLKKRIRARSIVGRSGSVSVGATGARPDGFR